MRMHIIEPIRSCFARTPDPRDRWLWCRECERFFHFDRLVDRHTDWPRCPFPDCIGYGWDFHIFFWDQFREPEDSRWPRTAAELRHGMRSPEMDSWYEARRQERIDHMVAAFDASDEGRGGPSRFIRPFLKMSGDLCWDLSDPEDDVGFAEDLARGLFEELPVWAQTAAEGDAGPMLAELRRFFDFAARTDAVLDAQSWRRLLEDDSIADCFVYTMRNDRRLRRRGRVLHSS